MACFSECLDPSLGYNQGILALKCPQVFNMVINDESVIKFGFKITCRLVIQVDT